MNIRCAMAIVTAVRMLVKRYVIDKTGKRLESLQQLRVRMVGCAGALQLKRYNVNPSDISSESIA